MRLDQLVGLGFVAPAVIVVIGVLLYPTTYNIVVSLQSWSWFSPPAQRGVWNGFANYAHVFASPTFSQDAVVTVRFVVLAVGLEYVLGFGLALIMSANIRGRGFFRTLFLLPMMIAPVVVGIQWHWLLSGDIGIVNNALQDFGLNPPVWLSSPTWAPYAVIAAYAWQNIPFTALILLAALQSIPTEIYEAARVDGASSLQQFWRITLPLLTTASVLAIVIRLGDALKVFDLIFLMTGGGPARATEVLSLYTYWVGFSEGDLGQAAAAANIVALLSLVSSGVLIFLVRSRTESRVV
jgi:multiple sugar transport system permease protein